MGLLGAADCSDADAKSGLDISPVITHRLPYDEFETGFQLMKSGQCGKIILRWSD
jgi:threonine 3-dehydrogenase